MLGVLLNNSVSWFKFFTKQTECEKALTLSKIMNITKSDTEHMFSLKSQNLELL